MAKIRITLDGYRCERCQHEWIKRKNEEPTVCPKCKSPYWNKPKIEKLEVQNMTEYYIRHEDTSKLRSKDYGDYEKEFVPYYGSYEKALKLHIPLYNKNGECVADVI